MLKNKIVAYLWMMLGFYFLIFIGGKLVFQLLGLILGFSLIFKGLRLLAIDRAVYNYSRNYFEDNFKM